MTILRSAFGHIINISIAASFLMLAVILLRPFLKRVPKWLVCILWGMVAVRLVVPFSLESRWSLVPAWKVSVSSEDEVRTAYNGNLPYDSEAEDWQGESKMQSLAEDHAAERIGDESINKFRGNSSGENSWQGISHENDGETLGHPEETMDDGLTSKQNGQGSIAIAETKEHDTENIQGSVTVNDESGNVLAEEPMELLPVESEVSENVVMAGESMRGKAFEGALLIIGSGIWLAGVIAMLAYAAISFLRLSIRLRTAVRLEEGESVKVWMSDAITEPFVLRMVRPRIYLPSCLESGDLDCVLCHERAHIKRGDYLWKPFGFLILCVYWFHPLCWISYLLFCRDVEMACDEKATKDFNMQERKRYCQALLNLSQGKKNSLVGTVAFGENGTKSRVKAVLNYKKPSFWMFIAGLLACMLLGILFMTSPKGKAVEFPPEVQKPDTVRDEERNPSLALISDQSQGNQQELGKGAGESSDETSIRLSGMEAWEAEGIDISDFYARDDGDIQNAYVIDEEGILWGYGENRYGQLGQGFADQKFYKEKVKVAENAIHVDDSETGFVIYLKEDHKLYGLGNDGSGVLLTGGNIDWNSYVKGEEHAVCTPVLLMEHVQYACCGRNDIVCLMEDGSVWTWGFTGISTARVYNFVSEPIKILDGAILVTGGLFNHAALLEDGSVWTWGYNYAGGCGVSEFGIVESPTKVAENVIRVWTSRKRTNTCADYETMSPINEKQMENTIIEKADHSFFSCGEGVGNKERVLKKYYEAVDFPMICTHEFLPCMPLNPDGSEVTARQAFLRFLSGDRTLLNSEQEKQGSFAGFLTGLDFGFSYEYVLMDLDGDGTEELIVQGGDNLGDYNGVFHWENGKIVSWRDDAFESDRAYLLLDGSLAKRWSEYAAGRESWTVFRYLSSGEEREIKRLVYGNPSADWVEMGFEERDYPWYEIDGVEVTKEEFQREYKKSIYDKRVTSWTSIATGEENKLDEISVLPNTKHSEKKWITKLEDFDQNGEEEYLTVEAIPVSRGSGNLC